jgi:magnesium-transporting ATPase (P-type)
MSDNAATPAGATTPVPFWQLPQAELERQIGSGPKGLSAEEAAARLLRHGPNAFGGRRRYGLALKMASRFRNPLVLILIGAALISALTGELASIVIISVMVLLSVVLDSLQEYRAEEAADRLRASVALMERVLRDGREITIKAEALVPGDLVLLSAGDLVPADGRLVEAKDFFINEALLTGEAFPTEKHAIAEGARAKRKLSSSGRWNRRLTRSTKRTRSTVNLTISIPNSWIPCSRAAGGGVWRSPVLIAPSCVAGPVATTRKAAVPLTTELPMKAALDAPVISDSITRWPSG